MTAPLAAMTAPLRLCVRRTPIPVGPARAVQVQVKVPSDVDLVEETVELVARHCFAGFRPSSRTIFRLRLALAEALANAIMAGNARDSNRRVSVEVELFPDRIRLGVSDEGKGFDPAATPNPTLPDSLENPCGRGLFIIRHLADRVEFNDLGNTIWMTLPRC